MLIDYDGQVAEVVGMKDTCAEQNYEDKHTTTRDNCLKIWPAKEKRASKLS